MACPLARIVTKRNHHLQVLEKVLLTPVDGKTENAQVPPIALKDIHSYFVQRRINKSKLLQQSHLKKAFESMLHTRSDQLV